MHICRDSTAIPVRSKPIKIKKSDENSKKKRGRPRKDEIRTEKPLKTIEKERFKIRTTVERANAYLKEVVDKYHPDRILIEPSGVGKLSDVIKAVQGVQGDVDIVLNSYTTVVDAKKCKMYMRNFGEFFNNQVEYAGAIIMSRTDIIDEKKAQQAMELLRC